MAVGNFNGDTSPTGHPYNDLAVANSTGNAVSVLLNAADWVTTVAGTKLFYKGSPRWNVTNANLPGFSDDNAIAADKIAYHPGGGTSAFSEVSSYAKGINGLMVDLAGAHGPITANDFTFKVGNNNSPSTWATATAPTTVTVRSGAGASGSDRIELLWADNAIEKTWLEVIVKGNDALGGFNTNTELTSSYVFYFGSAPGDSGSGDTTTFLVNSTDEQSARNNPKSTLGTPATITDVNDFNRDGNVNTIDQQAVRNNATNALTTALKFLNIGAEGSFGPAIGGGTVAVGDSGIASGLAVTSCSSTSTNGAAAPDWISERLATMTSGATSTVSASAVADAVLGGDGADDDENGLLDDLLADVTAGEF